MKHRCDGEIEKSKSRLQEYRHGDKAYYGYGSDYEEEDVGYAGEDTAYAGDKDVETCAAQAAAGREDAIYEGEEDGSGGYDEYDAYDEYDDLPEEDTAGWRQSGRGQGGKKRRRHCNSNKVEITIIGVLVVIFAVCLCEVILQLVPYLQAMREYDELSTLFETVQEEASGIEEEVIPEAEGEEETAPESQEEETSESEEEEASQREAEQTLSYPALSIDFDALESINSEFVGIIHIPALDLTYPIAQAENNSDYLTKTFEGSTNSSGCIFLDYLSSPDFSDGNTYIYGHNMKNQTMFGSLKLFMQDEDLCDEEPYIYIYLEDRVLIYRIFAYYTTAVGSGVYNDFYDEEGYDDYISMAISSSMYSLESGVVDWTERPNILTLSTCYSTGHKYNFIVQGALAASYNTSQPASSDEAAETRDVS